MGNALEQLRKETRDDARLYGCIRELYEQGVPFEELKAVIPDIRRTREQLHMKRMLENNNEVLMQMFSREMSFLLDAKERQEEEQFKKIDQLIRQQQSYRKAAAEAGLEVAGRNLEELTKKKVNKIEIEHRKRDK